MRAFRALPFAGADKNLAIFPAFLTMKFINWHGLKITRVVKNLKPYQPR